MENGALDLMRLKVVVIGLENSGKTTLINKLSSATKNVEHSIDSGKTITLGFDIGKTELAGCSVHFFAAPGQRQFEFARKIVFRGAHIGILMVDSVSSTDESAGERQRDLEQELIGNNIPYFVCANKRDIPGVLALSEIQAHFSAPVYPVELKTDSGVNALRDVLASVIEVNKHSWLAASEKKLTCE